MKLSGKVAIVTGAGRGIGRGIALSLAEEGADIVVADLNEENASKVAEEIKALNCQSLPIKVDVTSSGEVVRMVQKTIEKFGKIDILVNNAGIPGRGSIVELKEETLDAVFNVNVKGVFLCSKYVVPYMIKQKSGKIVNIGSQAGRLPCPYVSAYGASKAAVIHLTKSLAAELARYNINVNSVCPGYVYSGDSAFYESKEEFDKWVVANVPLRREQTIEDIAKAVVFLSSEDSKNITGESIHVDGGMVML
jgi:3-oxoacyl-[acyl-carrier protein] reductase